MRRLIGLLLLLSLAVSAFALPPAQVGLILMHGKSASPPGPLAYYFAREGFAVVSPSLPWGREREYDEPYRTVLEKLHQDVLRLREQGAKFVIVGGHSFGANAALAYQAEYGDADALMLFAPGHNPSGWYAQGLTKNEVDQAAELYKQGKLDQRISFDDPNSGNRSLRRTATVENYLSYFNPRGRASMSRSAAAIKSPLPVLLVNSADEARTQGREYIFAKLPAHPLSVYLEMPVGHTQAPDAARDEARSFVRSITQE